MKLLGSNLHSHPGGPQSTRLEHAWSPLLSLPARIVGKPRKRDSLRCAVEKRPQSREPPLFRSGGKKRRNISSTGAPLPRVAAPFPAHRLPPPRLWKDEGERVGRPACFPPSLPALRTVADPLGSATFRLFVRPDRCSTARGSALFETRREGEGRFTRTQAKSVYNLGARRGLRSFSASR